jgi:hypothetical protein
MRYGSQHRTGSDVTLRPGPGDQSHSIGTGNRLKRAYQQCNFMTQRVQFGQSTCSLTIIEISDVRIHGIK